MSKMITIKFFEPYLTGDTSVGNVYMTTASATKIDCVDLDTGNHLVFRGQGFSVSHGIIDRGTITSVTDTTPGGKAFFQITNLNIDARVVSGATMADFTENALQRLVNSDVKLIGTDLDDSLQSYKGNDRIFAGKGDDTLSGVAGRDTLIGGAGHDTFTFAVDYGKDTITDFDAVGGVGLQDFIGADFALVDSINQVGANTVINFGDGDTLTLLNVNKSLIDSTDFVI